MRNVVLTLILSCCYMSICFCTTSLDSIYREAYYTESSKKIIELLPSLEKEFISAKDLETLSKLYFLIAYKANDENDFLVAFKYYHKSYDKARVIKNYNRQRSTMVNISALFFALDDFKNAKIYTRRAIEYAEKLNQNDKIGAYYFDLGTYSRKQGNLDSAILFLEKSYKIELSNSNFERQAVVLNELGLCAYQLEDFTRAIDYYYRAANLDNSSSYIKSLVYTNHSLIELKRGNMEKAIRLVNKAIKKRKIYSDDKRELIPLHNSLGEMYIHEKQYDTAISVLSQAFFNNDWNGLNGANSEEFNLSLDLLEQVQRETQQPYLLTDLGIYEQYSNYRKWQKKSLTSIEKDAARLSLQLANERIIHDIEVTNLQTLIMWIVIFAIIFWFVGWQVLLFVRENKEVKKRTSKLS